MIELRGGFSTEDPRLDRVPYHDPRSRAYDVGEVVEGRPLRGRSHPLPLRLDQGSEGACTGFAAAHEAAAYPAVVRGLTDGAARKWYDLNRLNDEWPGEAYEGSSVLASMKVGQMLRLWDEYRWAFDVDDGLRALSCEGPGILGIPWYYSMFEPRPSGLLEVERSSGLAGYHAIVARGWLSKPRLRGESSKLGPVVRLTNSWGASWGLNGECFVPVVDLEMQLLPKELYGEWAFPGGRRAATWTAGER